MKTCWQHRGNIIFPTGGPKRWLSSSKLVDRALKMTSTAVVHQQQCLKKRGISGSSGNEWTSMSVRNLTAEVQIYDAPAKKFSFGVSICSVCTCRRMPKCQIQNKGKFVRRRLVVFWTAPEDLLTRFSPQDETRVPHLVPESKNESH